MSSGKIHKKINLSLGFAISGAMLGFNRPVFEVFSFLLGIIFSTLAFSPDSDLRPSSKSFIMKFLIYPYSIMFKHRGVSHSLILGTITRVLYGLVLSILIWIFLVTIGVLDNQLLDSTKEIYRFIINFNYQKSIYRIIVFLYMGMFVADFFHITVDKLSSFRKKNSLL